MPYQNPRRMDRGGSREPSTLMTGRMGSQGLLPAYMAMNLTMDLTMDVTVYP